MEPQIKKEEQVSSQVNSEKKRWVTPIFQIFDVKEVTNTYGYVDCSPCDGPFLSDLAK